MHLITAASLVSLAMSGCTVVITTGIFTDVASSSGVQIVAAVTAHGSMLDSVTARVTNTTAHSMFVPRCGAAPLLLAQQFVNGTWIDAPNGACPAGSALGPIELDPGLTLVTVKVFTDPGRFRLVTTVDDSEDFSSAMRSTSNVFAVR